MNSETNSNLNPKQTTSESQVLEGNLAGKFYPKTKIELLEVLQNLFEQARKEQPNKSSRIYQAIVAPHAGYIYSGLTAAHIYKYFHPQRFKKVLLVGPAHRANFDGVVTYSEDFYQTPLGKSPNQSFDSHLGISYNNEAFKTEHSVETQLPFIQYRLNEEKIALDSYPVQMLLYGNISSDKLAKKLEHIVDQDTFVVLSSDLSHYLPAEEARNEDEDSLNKILSGNPTEAFKANACGKVGIAAFLETKFSRGLEGYCSIGFASTQRLLAQSENVMSLSLNADFANVIDRKCQVELFKTLRKALQNYISEKTIYDCSSLFKKYPFFNQEASCFVTLSKQEKLRGCIGSLLTTKPLGQDIVLNTIKAAFEDLRFAPVTLEELDELSIAISILKQIRFLKCKNEFDLMNQIEPNVHGIIVQQGNRRATFLPEVWKKIPNKSEFLSQLCKKADLNPNAWRLAKERIQIFVYTVDVISEANLKNIAEQPKVSQPNWPEISIVNTAG
jgi:MEMO1 family protein